MYFLQICENDSYQRFTNMCKSHAVYFTRTLPNNCHFNQSCQNNICEKLQVCVNQYVFVTFGMIGARLGSVSAVWLMQNFADIFLSLSNQQNFRLKFMTKLLSVFNEAKSLKAKF
jgi:hypothetical protein